MGINKLLPTLYIIGEKMKFGREVKFIVNDDLLEEHDIAGDVQQLSELIDLIQGKSDKYCVSDLLSCIQSSAGLRKV